MGAKADFESLEDLLKTAPEIKNKIKNKKSNHNQINFERKTKTPL